jgi:pimeloyl-ACP methyl ester carboxylesterase
MRLVLLHGPLVGPAVWRPVAAEAARRGIEATVPGLPDLAAVSPPYYPRLAEGVAAQIAGEGPAVLAAHSAAGGLATSVVAAAGGLIAQVIFVDAILPHPGRSWFETAGDGFVAMVRAKAAGGQVPPWDQWFPPGAIAGLIDDPQTRAAFEAELRPVPEAFLDETAPDLDLPDAVGWAYLRLSKVYEDEARLARHEGRPTLRLDLHHLAAITHPGEVLSSILNLIRG